jgi:hypothetical protein
VKTKIENQQSKIKNPQSLVPGPQFLVPVFGKNTPFKHVKSIKLANTIDYVDLLPYVSVRSRTIWYDLVRFGTFSYDSVRFGTFSYVLVRMGAKLSPRESRRRCKVFDTPGPFGTMMHAAAGVSTKEVNA